MACSRHPLSRQRYISCPREPEYGLAHGSAAQKSKASFSLLLITETSNGRREDVSRGVEQSVS